MRLRDVSSAKDVGLIHASRKAQLLRDGHNWAQALVRTTTIVCRQVRSKRARDELSANNQPPARYPFAAGKYGFAQFGRLNQNGRFAGLLSVWSQPGSNR